MKMPKNVVCFQLRGLLHFSRAKQTKKRSTNIEIVLVADMEPNVMLFNFSKKKKKNCAKAKLIVGRSEVTLHNSKTASSMKLIEP